MTSEYLSRYFDVAKKVDTNKVFDVKTSRIIQNVLVNNKMYVTIQYL